MSPKVTILTMTHDYGRFLKSCIASVKRQTFQDIEHVIVDAGSTDNSAEILAEYFAERPDGTVKIISTPDLGLASSRNVGLDFARGEFVVNFDADDELHRDFLKNLLKLSDQKSVVCPTLVEFGEGASTRTPIPPFTHEAFLEHNRIFCCSMYPLTAVLAHGGYDAALDRLGCEDWELWTRLVKNGYQVKHAPDATFFYRVHLGSSTARLGVHHATRTEYIRSKHAV